MTPNEQRVYDTLEARYFDLRNIIASKLKARPDSEEVDNVTEKAVSKCLRLKGTYDPVKGTAWKWVMMVAWGQVQRFYRASSNHKARDKKVGPKRMPQDALARVKGLGDEVVTGLENLPERPGWPVGAEEDCLITAIDLKRGGVYEVE